MPVYLSKLATQVDFMACAYRPMLDRLRKGPFRADPQP